jgi:hypothetical protein
MRGILSRRDGPDTGVAAVWPVSAQVAPLPVLDIEPRGDEPAQRAEAGAPFRHSALAPWMGVGALAAGLVAVLIL